MATACFYPTDLHTGTLGEGKNADTLVRVREIGGELAMIWGRQDPHIPADGRAAIDRALTEAGRVFTWREVNAEHAFMRDEGPRDDPRWLASRWASRSLYFSARWRASLTRRRAAG